jgi:hypothetical protein
MANLNNKSHTNLDRIAIVFSPFGIYLSQDSSSDIVIINLIFLGLMFCLLSQPVTS